MYGKLRSPVASQWSVPLCLVMELVVLFVGLLAVVHGCEQYDEPPTWSSQHSASGVLYIPYAEIEEPFQAWYDGINQRSRIDYYGGMVKTYQFTDEGTYGSSYKLAPVTTETEANKHMCLQANGSDEAKVTVQDIVPQLTGFKCLGIDERYGASKWQMEQVIGERVNKYTIWLDGDSKSAVPRRYEMKGFNSLLGSHYDHYYLTYDNFDDGAIDDNVFELQSKSDCVGFPGPGVSHVYTFNPMAEFMHPTTSDHVDYEFSKFLGQHSHYYTGAEYHKRREHFRQNARFVHSHNRDNKTFTVELNHFADRSPAEMAALRGRRYTPGYNGGKPFPYNTAAMQLPDQFDWRLYGAVTPVKDQSVCGSCWSFGTIGAIEGAYFLKTAGKLVRLSQQALIDCSWGYGNNGCDGGEDFRAYQWMMKHGGVPTEEDYGPYLGQDGYCHADKVRPVAKITGYVNVTANSPQALKLALIKNGPISVAIDASHRTFSFYSKGVYEEPSCGNGVDQLDHAVLLVGYGTLGDKPYWLIKNSWSTYWGNDGYVLMSPRDNNCGVMTTPTYVTM